jgi:ABC-2 type transport system ATP-binding protein
MIAIESLVKHYGDTAALDGISLEVHKGEFLGLLGPNGAGKSTLMQCLTGYVRPDGGTVRYEGASLCEGDQRQRRIFGLVPQQIALYDTLCAVENMKIFGKLYGLCGTALRNRIGELLHMVQLADRQHEPVKNFSGGMKRRLNIAASLMHSPEILFCDEVTAGVDPQSRNAIFDMLERLNREGMTIVYTTHYMEEVARLCSRIAIIDHGRLIADGTLDQLLSLLPEGRSVTWKANSTATNAVAKETAPGFGSVRLDEASRRHVLFPLEPFDAGSFFNSARKAGFRPWDFAFRQGTLEDVFLHLTGNKLRDN